MKANTSIVNMANQFSPRSEGTGSPSSFSSASPAMNYLSTGGEPGEDSTNKTAPAATEAAINVLIVSPDVSADSNPPEICPSQVDSEQKDDIEQIVLQARHEPNGDISNSAMDDMRQTLKRSVRFRSRVRITSGVHAFPKARRPSNNSFETTTSNRSSSRSSSISAPLRDPATDNDSGVWRIGMPLHLSPAKNRSRRRLQQQQQQMQHRPYDPRTPLRHTSTLSTDQTPLLPKSASGPSYYSTADLDTDESEAEGDDESEQARLNREIDIVFGKWPGRLMNRHWWWWQLEPIVCCNACCLDESDTEPD